MDLCNRLHQGVRRVHGWQLWKLPRTLMAYIISVVAVWAAMAIRAAVGLPAWRLGDLLLFATLTGCGLIMVEMTRRAGESALFIRDMFAIWELPIALLLPPFYALIAPIPRLALTHCRIRRIAPHRRVLTGAAIGLSYGGASWAFHQFSRVAPLSPTRSASSAALWVSAVAGAFALHWLVNSGLVMVAVKGSDPSASVRALLFDREHVHNDAVEGSVSVIVTLALAVTPVTLLFALPFVSLLQRSSRHTQLLAQSRLDGKTGLLNAVTWRRESSAEVDRAVRSGSPVSVALVDIDHFKRVNDMFGHLAGDEALRAVSDVLQSAVRESDIVGRFGGEEFSLLLAHADASEARDVAERIRERVAALRVRDIAERGGVISLTVSVGVAALPGGATGTDVNDLLAAADNALYRAKGGGRDQVWVTTEHAITAVTSPRMP